MIGTLPSTFMKDILRVTINPLDTLLIYDKFIPGFYWTEETDENFLKSGFRIQSSFISLVVTLMKACFGYGIFMIFATNFTAWQMHSKRPWVHKTADLLNKMAFVSYPIRALNESVFFILMAIAVEINQMMIYKPSTL